MCFYVRKSSMDKNPSTSCRIGKPDMQNVRFPEILLQIPPGISPKYENHIFGVFFRFFLCFWGGIFSISWRGGMRMSGWHFSFLAYFGFCGFFCSGAGLWVLNSRGIAIEFPHKNKLSKLVCESISEGFRFVTGEHWRGHQTKTQPNRQKMSKSV